METEQERLSRLLHEQNLDEHNNILSKLEEQRDELEKLIQYQKNNISALKANLSKTDKKSFKWNDDQVFDFVNWYVELNKLDFIYTLENREIIESFKRGDKASDWHQK